MSVLRMDKWNEEKVMKGYVLLVETPECIADMGKTFKRNPFMQYITVKSHVAVASPSDRQKGELAN